ncbi:MAG TPA: hypothetical protein EYP30_09525 [Archaeoglobaceae archaeon]|nr:hypothetical protein [Archaeoglobaceae archaeon]
MIRKAIVILGLLTVTALFAHLYPAHSDCSENFRYEIKYEGRDFKIEDRIGGIEFGCFSCNRTGGIELSEYRDCELNFALLTCCSNDSKVEYAKKENNLYITLSSNLYITLSRGENCSLAMISGTIYGEGRYNLTFVIEDTNGRKIADKVSFEARV